MRACEDSGPPVFERLGLARPPLLTAVITVFTGAVSVCGLVSPAVLPRCSALPRPGTARCGAG
jgi:hypothetical protein